MEQRNNASSETTFVGFRRKGSNSAIVLALGVSQLLKELPHRLSECRSFKPHNSQVRLPGRFGWT